MIIWYTQYPYFLKVLVFVLVLNTFKYEGTFNEYLQVNLRVPVILNWYKMMYRQIMNHYRPDMEDSFEVNWLIFYPFSYYIENDLIDILIFFKLVQLLT